MTAREATNPALIKAARRLGFKGKILIEGNAIIADNCYMCDKPWTIKVFGQRTEKELQDPNISDELGPIYLCDEHHESSKEKWMRPMRVAYRRASEEIRDIWKEKPDYVWVPRGYSSRVKIKDDDIQMLNLEETDAWLENLKGKITQLNECLGEYESHEWCSHCIIDAKCAQITLHVQELKENTRKADLWDQYAIYDNDNEPEILVKDLIIAYERLEAVKNIVKEFEYPHPFLRGDHNDWLNRLRKILGGENNETADPR